MPTQTFNLFLNRELFIMGVMVKSHPNYDTFRQIILEYIRGKKYEPLGEKELFKKLSISLKFQALCRMILEDLVQEVLIAVIDALPSFRGECTLLHFAIRIAARRTTAVRRRSRSITGWLELFWRNEHPLSAEPVSPRDETISDRRRTLMRTLLGELPEAQTEAMVLRLALGYSIEEIAAISSAPINTVRSRLRLAKDALRSRIEADPRWAELWEDES